MLVSAVQLAAAGGYTVINAIIRRAFLDTLFTYLAD